MITDEQMMRDYKPRLIIFTFMKQIIYDFYNYVQVNKDYLIYLKINLWFVFSFSQKKFQMSIV